MGNDSKSYLSQVKQIGLVTTIPILLVAGPALGYFLGNWIDRKAGFFPWGSIAGIAVGFIAAVREMVRIARVLQSQENRDKNN